MVPLTRLTVAIRIGLTADGADGGVVLHNPFGVRVSVFLCAPRGFPLLDELLVEFWPILLFHILLLFSPEAGP